MNRTLWMVVVALTAVTGQAELIVGAWRPIFQGIDLAVGTNQPGAAIPWQQVVRAMRIDLQDPDVRFFTTPRAAAYQVDFNETGGDTVGGFLQTYGLQAAINANFFSLYNERIVGAPQEVYGLAMCTGQVVSVLEPGLPGYYAMVCAFLFTADNQVTPVLDNLAGLTDLAPFYTAVTGSYPLLMQGVNVGFNYLGLGERIHLLNPRTAMGVSADRRYLILLVIDGRQYGYSDGALDWETAEWLRQFGAWDAINLDGGGSSTMVMADSTGAPLCLNSPSDGQERVVAQHFGVYARPLPAFITDLKVTPSSSGALLTWTTPEPATTQLEYGSSTRSRLATARADTPRLYHVVLLAGLTPASRYSFQGIATTPTGLVRTLEGQFQTLGDGSGVSWVGWSQAWKYSTNNLDGVEWQRPEYDDWDWFGAAPGPFYIAGNPDQPSGNTPLPTAWGVSGTPVVGSALPSTYYFRTHFYVADRAAVTDLVFTNLITGGAIVYLNGLEVQRVRLPLPPTVVDFGRWADRCCEVVPPGDSSEPWARACVEGFALRGEALAALLTGDNLLAVELHNCDPFNSELLFGLALSSPGPAAPPSPLLACRVAAWRAGTTVVVDWDVVGLRLLQAADPKGPWFEVPGPITAGPYSVEPGEARRFYRVAR